MVLVRVLLPALLLFLIATRKNELLIGEIADFDLADAIFSSALPTFWAELGAYTSQLAIVILVALLASRSDFRRPALPALLYGAFAIFYNLRIADSDAIAESAGGIIVAGCICLLSLRPSDVRRQLQLATQTRDAFVLFALSYVGVNFVLMISGYGYHGYRFSGLSYHPNQFAQIAALSTAGLLLASSQATTWSLRATLWTGAALAVVLLIAAGSRGALVCLFVGLFAIVYLKRGSRWVVLATAATAALLFGSLFYLDTGDELLARLLDTGDNRSEAFQLMWDTFLDYPLIGNGTNAGATENSMLKALAATGLVGGILFAGFLGTALVQALKVLAARQALPQQVLVAVLVLMVLSSSLLDGYMVEKLSFSGVLLVLMLASVGDLARPGSVGMAEPGASH
jgi:O-antigen ligase